MFIADKYHERERKKTMVNPKTTAHVIARPVGVQAHELMQVHAMKDGELLARQVEVPTWNFAQQAPGEPLTFFVPADNVQEVVGLQTYRDLKDQFEDLDHRHQNVKKALRQRTTDLAETRSALDQVVKENRQRMDAVAELRKRNTELEVEVADLKTALQDQFSRFTQRKIELEGILQEALADSHQARQDAQDLEEEVRRYAGQVASLSSPSEDQIREVSDHVVDKATDMADLIVNLAQDLARLAHQKGLQEAEDEDQEDEPLDAIFRTMADQHIFTLSIRGDDPGLQTEVQATLDGVNFDPSRHFLERLNLHLMDSPKFTAGPFSEPPPKKAQDEVRSYDGPDLYQTSLDEDLAHLRGIFEEHLGSKGHQKIFLSQRTIRAILSTCHQVERWKHEALNPQPCRICPTNKSQTSHQGDQVADYLAQAILKDLADWRWISGRFTTDQPQGQALRSAIRAHLATCPHPSPSEEPGQGDQTVMEAKILGLAKTLLVRLHRLGMVSHGVSLTHASLDRKPCRSGRLFHQAVREAFHQVMGPHVRPATEVQGERKPGPDVGH